MTTNEFEIKRTNLHEYVGIPQQMKRGVIVLITSGQAVLEINLQHYVVEHGESLLLAPPDVILIASTSADFQCRMLCFSGEMMVEATARFEANFMVQMHTRVRKSSNEISYRLMSNIIELIEFVSNGMSAETTRAFIIMQLRSIFLCLNEVMKEKQPKPFGTNYFSRSDEHAKTFMDLLHKHAHEAREVLFYANEMSITPKYLNTVIRAASGHSPKEIINGYVTLLLKVELKATEKTIDQIADEYNFPSQSYMGRFFKKFTGQSPTDFRKAEKGKTENHEQGGQEDKAQDSLANLKAKNR